MQNPLFIKWNEHNETGIALLDEQHRGIVSIINTFFYMMSCGTDNRVLYSSIGDTLKKYSHIHFITEEAFLKDSGYEDAEAHKELHRKYALEIERNERESVSDNDPGPLLEFLKKWWTKHINEEDRLYVPHLRDYYQKLK
ncbi:MAG: bacteriohemerythrin [Betaproteobacteria bacterium]|nr:bacteriohemerythrin [Betaproteobacteria bacterium]